MSGSLLRVIARVVALLPFSALPTLGRALAFVACSVLRIRRAHVAASLARAGIALDPREVYRELGTSAFELLWLSARTDVAASSLVRIEGLERFEAARALGRGVVVATAHTGNWDLAACACAWHTPLTVVTKRLSTPSIDRFWQESRRTRGVDLVAAPDGGVLRAARDRLAAGHAVALLVDQDPERTTSVVSEPFLGEVAVHDTLAATLSARTGAPIVVAFARRTTTGQVVDIVGVIEPPRGADRTWIFEATRRIARALETHVRAAPAGWLWLHRRWKTSMKTTLKTTLTARRYRACTSFPAGNRSPNCTPSSRSSPSPSR